MLFLFGFFISQMHTMEGGTKMQWEAEDTVLSEDSSVKVIETQTNHDIKVLVVDDEKIMRDLLKEIITQSTGYFVDVAESGEEALKKYKKELHSLIVLDVRLDGKLSGMDLLYKIKKIDQVANIIMVTGYGTISLAVECMKAGAWDFITKPFSYDHFTLIINRAAENIILKGLAKERSYFMELSRLDGLTEVYNRRMFDLILKAEISRSQRNKKTFFLVFLDVDNFKEINDQFGHLKGDEVLKRLALAMKHVSRESDFLFRYGGDEFVLLLPETEKEGAQIFTSRLKEKLQHIEIQGNTAQGQDIAQKVTVSMGIVSYPSSAKEPESLIAAADVTLFEAKKKNKNHIVFG
jgi:diguanylate cyclase (GGDEF)-like protein